MRRIVNIELDVRKEVHNKISFSVNQYDDVTMRATLYDGLDEVELSDDDQIVLTVKKQDGKYVTQDANMVRENNTLIIEWSKQCSNVEGVHELELAIKDKTGLLTTAITKFMVKKPITTGVIDIINSTDDIHVLFEIKEFLEQCELALQDIADAIEAVNERIDELKLELQGEYNKLVIELQNKKNELILEIGNKKDEFIGNVNDAKDNALTEIRDRVDIVLEQSLKDFEAVKDVGIKEIQDKINEGKAIVGEIQQIKDTLATKKELSDTKDYLEDIINRLTVRLGDYATIQYVDNQDVLLRIRIDQVNNKLIDYATKVELGRSHDALELKKADRLEFTNLRDEVNEKIYKKADLDHVSKIYSTHAELKSTENRLQVQIDALNGNIGGFVTIKDLQDAYDELDKDKADKTDLDPIKADVAQNKTDIADLKTNYATKKELEDTYLELDDEKADKLDLLNLETELARVENEVVRIETECTEGMILLSEHFTLEDEVLQQQIDDLDAKKADKTELADAEKRLQDQIDLLGGVAGRVASLQQLTDTYNYLENSKATKVEVQQIKTALETKDAELEAKINKNIADIADLDTNKADKTALNALDIRVTNVENAVLDIQNDFATKDELNTAKAELEVKINKNATDIQALQAEDVAIKADVAQNKADIANLKPRVEANEIEVARLEREKADKAELATLGQKVDKNTADITDLTNRVDQNEQDIMDISADITIIEQEIVDLDTNKADKTALEATRIDLQNKIDAINGGAGGFVTQQEFQQAKQEIEAKKADRTDLNALATKQELTTAKDDLDARKADKTAIADMATNTQLAQTRRALEQSIDTKLDATALAGYATTAYVDTAKNDLDTRKADKTALDQTNAKVATIEQSVATKAEQADLTALEQRVTTNEGKIAQNETDITNIKTNYVSDVSIVDGMLKQTKNNNPVDVGKIITKWGDLEYVDEYKYANLYDKDAVEAEKNLSSSGVVQLDPGNLEWGVIKIPLKQSQPYTMFKKTGDNNFKISMRDSNDAVVGTFIDVRNGTIDNGWYRHKFDTPANTAYAYIEARLRTNESGKDILVEGDVPASEITTEIPYLSDNRIRIQKGVTVEFDKKTSTLTSKDVNSAILEVNTEVAKKADQTALDLKADKTELAQAKQELNDRIDRLNVPNVPNNVLTSINRINGNAGNITLDMEVTGDSFNLKVEGQTIKTLPMMTEAQEREIIALFI